VKIHNTLVGNPEGERPLQKTRLRWEDNIETDLEEIGCETMNWIHPAQDMD
jgi:hypothetical protein